MKRKYLSALLMGVLTLTSVSTFTSCKDYDDDISNLQEQIDKLATADQLSQKVAELQALISSNKSDITSLQTKVAEALTAAQKAQTTADSKTTLDEVKDELKKYATNEAVADVKATLEAAQKALEEKNDAALKDAVKKAQDAADKAVADAKAAVEEVKTDLANYKTTVASEQKVVDAALTALNTKVDAKADTTALNKAIKDLNEADAKAKAELLDKLAEETKGLVSETQLKSAIDALKKGDLAAVNKIAQDALDKANKAESDKGLAYLKALAAEGAAADAAKDAAKADAKAVKNQTDIKNIQDALGAGFDAKNTVAKAIQLINDQLTAKNTGLSGLNARLESIESKLKLEDPDNSLVKRVEKIEDQLKEIIGEYTTMVTEVSLLGSYVGGSLAPLGETTLKFTSGTVAQNITFGKAEKASEDYQVPAAENQQTFVEGTTFNTKSELVVRVNPVNAVLTKAAIKLVDSKGNNLDNVLEIGEPKPFDKLLYTRGSNNTGLWTIPVTVKAGVPASKIAQLTKVNGADKHILYAVAVNNTSSEAAKDRYVTSTYDITVPKADKFEEASNINNVKIKSVNTMAAPITLGAAMRKAGDTTGEIVPAKSGEDITIDFSEYSDTIQYFYVVRDDSNVDGGSGSSAINAWKSYEYGGSAYGKVVEVNPAEKKPTLNIKINGQKGDKIGFRIFAIHYNGKVTPQYGESFVVNVGEDESQASVAGDLLAKVAGNNSTAWLPLTGKLKDAENGVKLCAASTNHVFTADNGIKFKVDYSTNGVNSAAAGTKNSDIKFVKFTTVLGNNQHMSDWKDGSKANFTISQKDNDGMVENQIAVSLTKKLPTAADAKKTYTWKDEQLVHGVYTAYVTPTGDVWTTAASANTTGYQKLTQAITGLNETTANGVGFHITIDGVKKENNKWVADDFTADDSWMVSVVPELIDGKTQHKTTISYNWGKISSDNKDANGDYVLPLETVQTIFACPLTADVQKYTWDKYVETEMVNGQSVKKYYEVNYLTYGSTTTAHSVKLLQMILGKNSYDNTIFGGTLKDLMTTKYVMIKDVQLVSAVSGKQDYFKASYTPGDDDFTFTVNSESSNPAKDVTSYLKFTVVDAFGHEIPYSLDFTVKRRAQLLFD